MRNNWTSPQRRLVEGWEELGIQDPNHTKASISEIISNVREFLETHYPGIDMQVVDGVKLDTEGDSHQPLTLNLDCRAWFDFGPVQLSDPRLRKFLIDLRGILRINGWKIENCAPHSGVDDELGASWAGWLTVGIR